MPDAEGNCIKKASDRVKLNDTGNSGNPNKFRRLTHIREMHMDMKYESSRLLHSLIIVFSLHKATFHDFLMVMHGDRIHKIFPSNPFPKAREITPAAVAAHIFQFLIRNIDETMPNLSTKPQCKNKSESQWQPSDKSLISMLNNA